MIRLLFARAREDVGDVVDVGAQVLVDELGSVFCRRRGPTIEAMAKRSRPLPPPSREHARPIAPPGRPAAAVVEHIDDEEDGVIYQRELQRCNRRTCWCAEAYPERGHGPYWYAYYLDRSGRWRSVYLGKEFRKL